VNERLLSKKEKCLFNLINQLTAEAQWKNLAWTLFRKLSVPFVQRIRQYNSISAFGRDIRCLAYALRLSEEEHSVREVQNCLRQMLTMILLERNSDFALPALCYIVLLLAEHVTAVLSDVKDETVERIRQMLAIHLATMDKSLHDTTMGALQLHCGGLMEAERLKIEPATAVMFNLWLEERLHSALDAGNSGITMDEYGNVKVSLFLSESHRMCIGMLEFGQVKLMPMDDRAKLVAGKMVYCIEWLNEKLDKDNHHQEPGRNDYLRWPVPFQLSLPRRI